MIEIIFAGSIFVLGFILGHVKGSMDEEERQRKLRKKIYSVRGEDNGD